MILHSTLIMTQIVILYVWHHKTEKKGLVRYCIPAGAKEIVYVDY